LPEVAGEGALMVDPFSIENIKSGILKIINDPNLRNALIIKGLENAKRFKVEKIANVYLTLYKEIE
jgi:glycosyltransferase involved in cell wall biosynthesis